MPELLLELFSEEIPARMQVQAAKDLERLIVGALSDRGLLFEGARAFAGPRRLTLAIAGLPAQQPDVTEEKKGPRVGAPEKAVEGFLKSAGLSSLDQCEKRSDGKGEFYVATVHRKGRPTAEVIAEIVPAIAAKFPWPKSMRWGTGQFRWVRPLHGIVATFDGEVVPFEIAGVKSGNKTLGHRFLSQGAIEVRRFDDYEEKLRKAHVLVDGAERRETILHDARNHAFALGLELTDDHGLADEVMGLAEWPVVLIGRIDEAYMDVPPEILQTAMRTHQKYFALKDVETGKLANKFAFVANMIADDGDKAIVAGNERVLRARLSDAKFFWDQDRKGKLGDRVDALNNVVYHAKLGTQYERVRRIQALAAAIAKTIGADAGEAKHAAWLCKADLTTGVVGEFPELQGVMGRYYALDDGEPASIADAIRDHYRPLGPHDVVPNAKVAIAVALADKLDALTGFFAVGEKPTGSGDPFGLRRAALGVIRIILENKIRLSLMTVENFGGELLEFFADRMKVSLRDKGVRHDLVDAVFSLRAEDDLLRVMARVEALQAFLKTDDGANLLTGYRRAANILKAERKKEKNEDAFQGVPDTSVFKQAEEIALAEALPKVSAAVVAAVGKEDFVGAMSALAKMRAPVDVFFEHVTVNADDKRLRENRLKLLQQVVAIAHRVADFSKIEG